MPTKEPGGCTNPAQYNGDPTACTAAGCVVVSYNTSNATVYFCTAP